MIHNCADDCRNDLFPHLDLYQRSEELKTIHDRTINSSFDLSFFSVLYCILASLHGCCFIASLCAIYLLLVLPCGEYGTQQTGTFLRANRWSFSITFPLVFAPANRLDRVVQMRSAAPNPVFTVAL